MGWTFYIIEIASGILFFVLIVRQWYKKNEKRIQDFLLGWLCYQAARDRGFIEPGSREADRIALKYAIKHNKKQTWVVVENGRRNTK